MVTRNFLLIAMILNLLHPVFVIGQDNGKAAARIESAIQTLSKAIENVQQIDEYSGMLVYREHSQDGVLLEPNFWKLKVRSNSTQIYCRNLKPWRGTEVLFQKGKHDDKILVNCGEVYGCCIRLTRMDPTNAKSLCNLRYSFPEKNIYGLSKHYLAYMKKIKNRMAGKVRILNNCKINKRSCSKLEIRLNANTKLQFSKLEIYIDQEYQIPVRFVGYGWQKSDTQKPPLIEEYTFVNLNISPAFTDHEFVETFASRTLRRQALDQTKGEHHFFALWQWTTVMNEFVTRLGLPCPH